MTDPAAPGRVLRVRVEIEGALRLAHDATLLVRVEDVGRADARAIVLGRASRVVTPDDLAHGGPTVTVALGAAAAGVEAAVRAHLDLDGDGVVSRGDYVNMERVAVPDVAAPGEVRVRLRRVE